MSSLELRGSHPCLARRCGHAETDHLATPELAGPNEVVIWCMRCRRHEVYRHRTWWRFGRGDSAPRRLTRISGPN